MKLKLQLTVTVTYDVDAAEPNEEVPLLKERLRDIAEDAFQNGVVTDDLGACVEDYTVSVQKL